MPTGKPYIRLLDLERGRIYEVEARNIRYAVWDGEHFIAVKGRRLDNSTTAGDGLIKGTCKAERWHSDLPSWIEISTHSRELFNFLTSLERDGTQPRGLGAHAR